MRKFLLLLTICIISIKGFSQDFSNKGKEFWITSGYHYAMATGTQPVMTLHLTSDVNTTYQVEAFGAGIIATGNITANQVTNVNIPSTYYTTNDGLFTNKAIHVTAPQPIVVYSFITQAVSSAATLCLPATVLGKQYYSANFTQISNSSNANSFITIIAIEDNTTVEIIPTASTKGGWAANSVNTVNLNKGEIYQVLGTEISAGSPANSDLTGTSVRSIASGVGGCKRIAVFSGSGRVLIGGCGNGADNLYQQLYPSASWGRKYLTVPSANNVTNYYRIIRTTPNANVRLNGTPVSPFAFTNNYYEFKNTTPNLIEADSSICVVQYFTSAGCQGNTNPYDPDMVVLNPVEQNISDVTLISSDRLTHTPIAPQHHIHIIMKNSGTAISSFLFDGLPIPFTATWVPHPADPTYSYLYLKNVSETYHTLKSDSGFNALAYGYASNESYAYSAGTNVKDLTQQLELGTDYGVEATPTLCVGETFKFKVYFPVPNTVTANFDSLKWSCTSPALVPGNLPITLTGPTGPTIDSTNIRNGKTVNWYSLPGLYSFNAPGTYTVTLTAYKSSNEGCGSEQDFDFQITVVVPQSPAFAVTTAPGCYLEPVNFEETTPQIPKPTYKWYWDFGDPASGAANTSIAQNPSHLFSGPGTYNIKFVDITTTGCISDTVRQTINIPDIPDATISGTTAVCINAASPTITITGSGGKLPYEIVYSINGVPQPPVTTATGIYTITNVPTNVAVPVTYSLVSIKTFGSAVCSRNINGQSATVTVNPNATLTYLSGPVTQTVCINSPITPVVYTTGNGSTGGALIVTPLNPGFNGTYGAATNSYTITGTPTVPGVYTLVLKPVGPCVDPAEPGQTMTITVNANATLNLAPTSGTPSPTLCINTPVLSPIVYDVGGGATGANVVFTPVLPAGITWNYNAATKQVTILGTPTVSGTYSFLVSTISTCTNPTPIGGTITINPDATISLTSLPATTNQTKCVNTNIAPIVYAIDGSVTSVTVNNLPPGVTYTYTPGTPGSLSITGAPTTNVGSPFNYTVVLAGPCQLPTPQTGVINVNPDAGITLISPTASPTICINNAINITYQVTGSVTAVNFTGTLPAGVTYVYTPGNPGSITIAGTPTASGPFNYNIALTGICQVPLPVSGLITVTPDATIGLNAGSLKNQAVCVNTPIATISYTLGGSATGGAVTFVPPLPGVTGTVTGNAVTILGTPTVVSNVPLVYTYHVVTTGPCVNPDSTGTITVNPDHVLNLNAGSLANQTVCSGIQIAPINYTMDGGATGVTVTGLPAAGLTYTVVGNLVTIIGAPTANVTYSFTTTGNGCKTVTKGGTITVVPLPTPDFSFTTPSCNTRTISFTDNTVPNAGTLSGWVWNFGDATPLSNIQNPTHSYLLPGTYTVSLVATTSPNGCSNAAPFTKQVVINERPKTDFTVPAIACVNDIALFNDASTSPITNTPFNAAGYKWDFGDPASGASNTQTGVMNGTHQFSAGGTYTVTHISESSAGCRDTITHTVNIASAPVSNFSVSGSGPLCVNDTVSIVNLSTIAVGNISKLEIYWDYLGAPGTIVTDNAPVLNTVYKHKYPNFQTPVTKTYTILVRTYSGVSCVNDKQIVITLNAVPKVQFTAMPDACYDATPFQITQATEVGGVPGTGVYSGPGVSATGIFNPVTAGVGTHTIKYTFTSVAGCVDTMSSTIKVLDTATAKFSYVTPVCDGNAITFKEESTAPTGVTLNNTFWNFGDGSPAEQHLPGSTFTHSFPTWGNYNVTMYNTSAYGCKSTSNLTSLRVNPIPVAVFNFVQTSVCLPNAAVSMVNTSSIADNSAITYLWNFGDPVSGALNTSSAKTPPPHVYSGTGPYTVTLTVKGAVGTNGACQQVISHVVNFIHPQPKAVFDFSKPEVCIGGDVIVTDKTNGLDGTVQQWFWDFGDGIKANTAQVQHLYTSASTYNVALYIVNSQGCNSDTLTQQFTVHPYPVVDAGPDKVVLEGGSVTMQPTVTGNDLQYLWSPATYLNNTNTATPTANIIMDDITYTLTVTGRGGCTAPPDKMFIKVLKAPKIPNTFTPNGDGINENWLIDYLDTYPNCRVQVFTRTGQLVFESRGYKTPWNGTIGGKPLPFDTYYYIIEPGNGRAPMTGYVTIVK